MSEQRYGAIDWPVCPQCGERLELVEQSSPRMLNDDQFDAIKAGDWCCRTCPGNGRGKSGLAYFWNREVVLPDRRKRSERRTAPRPIGDSERDAVARLESLCRETWQAHRDPSSHEYNECDKDPCAWCEDTRTEIARLRQRKP